MRTHTPMLLIAFALAALLLAASRSTAAPTDTLIYGDALTPGWEDWSWNSSRNLQATTPVYAGSHSVAVTLNGWGGFSLHHDALVPGPDNVLSFWVHGGGSGGQTLNLFLHDGGGGERPHLALNAYVAGGAIAANEWREVRVPLQTLLAGSASWTRLNLQEATGATQPTFYLDSIRLVADGSVPTPTATPTAAPAAISVNAVPLRPLPPLLGGTNMAVWNADERFAPDVPTLARLRAAQPTLLRFPGGSTSDVYHWKDNQPPFDSDDWDVNTEAFIMIADEVGAERMITANFGSGTAQEAADWVRFTNVTHDWNVQYWEVGNEIYGGWETSWTHDGRAYVEGDGSHDGFNKFCRAMKAVDPTIQVGLIGTLNATEYDGWLTEVLSYADRDCTDFVSLHRYPLGPNTADDADRAALLADPPAAWPTIFAEVRAAMRAHFGRELPIHVTEYNSYYTQPSAPAVQTMNLLFLADTLGQFAVNGAAGAAHWDVMNGRTSGGGDYGILLVDEGFRRQPSYYLFPLWAQMGDHLLEASSNTPSIRAYATRHGAGGDLALMVINQGPPRTVALTIENFAPGSPMLAWQAVGASLDATTVTWNGEADPPNDLSQVPPLSIPINGNITLDLPGTSVIVFRIPGTSGPTPTPTTATPTTATRTPTATVIATGVTSPTPEGTPPTRERLFLPLVRVRGGG